VARVRQFSAPTARRRAGNATAFIIITHERRPRESLLARCAATNERYARDPVAGLDDARTAATAVVRPSRISFRFNVPQSVLVAGRRHARTRASTRRRTPQWHLLGTPASSTPEQSLDRQLDELRAHGCNRVFTEAASGKRGARRPEWDACLGHLRAGDALVVVELSRLGRNTGDLGRLLDHLDEHHVGLQILNLGIDTTTPAGRLIFTIIGAVAAMERELLVERTQSGLAAARARGRVGGRRRSFTPAQQREAQRLYDMRGMTVEQIARAVSSSSSTIYRYVQVDGKWVQDSISQRDDGRSSQ
jgi:DNA invertase Pin-like site-specific DNA recombinase